VTKGFIKKIGLCRSVLCKLIILCNVVLRVKIEKQHFKEEVTINLDNVCIVKFYLPHIMHHLNSQIGFPDMRIIEEFLTGPFQDDSAIFQDISPIADGQGMFDVLFNQ
jgi:hypothetical protein